MLARQAAEKKRQERSLRIRLKHELDKIKQEQRVASEREEEERRRPSASKND